MAEQIILDPSEVSTSRTSLDLTPWLNSDGVDWGTAEIQAYMSDQFRGSSPVDYRVPNRQISGGLVFARTIGGTSPAQARANIQAKLARIQDEGGWLKRITAAGSIVYADLVNASFSATSYSGIDSRQGRDTNAEFSLEALPDFYGDEITLTDASTTTATQLVSTYTGIKGDFPGRVRIVVDNDEAAQTQVALIWAWRSRYYSAASTAAVSLEAESLQALDTAAKAALSGASGGTVVTHGTLSTNWTPVVGTNIGGTAYLTHQGTYRLRARVYSTSGTTVQVRATWDVGDLIAPTENAAVRLPGASNFYIVDLGELRLDAAPVGTHRWQGQIQAKGDAGAENVSIDALWLQNLDEGAGLIRYRDSSYITTTSIAASDAFAQTAGSLTGKVLPTGGTWTGAGDAGGTADYQTLGSPNYFISRGALDDADTSTGRYALAGVPGAAANSILTNTWVQVKMGATDLVTAPLASGDRMGVFARYVDTSNWLAWVAYGTSFKVIKRVAGSYTVLADNLVTTSATIQNLILGAFASTFALLVTASGNWSVYRDGALMASGYDSALATGGTLASGKVGIYDARLAGPTLTRYYDDFYATGSSTNITDAVIFPSRSVQLTTDGMYRQDSSGSAYGPVSVVEDALPRIPVAGLEGRTTELLIKATRGDFADVADSGIDDISAQVFYRPSYLFLPNG